MIKTEELTLTQDWDKTFPKSEKVGHSKVTFPNRYGITLAADLYVPENPDGKTPLLPFPAPSVRSRNSAPACMPRRWPNAAL